VHLKQISCSFGDINERLQGLTCKQDGEVIPENEMHLFVLFQLSNTEKNVF